MNDQDESSSSSSPTPPVAPMRTHLNNRSISFHSPNKVSSNVNNTGKTVLTYNYNQMPIPSITSQNNATNAAARLVHKTVQMGSIQSLEDNYNFTHQSHSTVGIIRTTITSSNDIDTNNDSDLEETTSSLATVSSIPTQLGTVIIPSLLSTKDQVPNLPFDLISGEITIIGDSDDFDIAYVFNDNRSIKGKFYLTNYRLYFKSNESSTNELNNQNGNIIEFNLALGYINRIEKIGHQSSKTLNSYGMIVTCKDGRRLKFALNNEKRSRKQIYDNLHKYAFPLSNSMNFFAYLYKHEYQFENGWLVYDAKQEFKRMGVLDLPDWRLSDINQNYTYCDTYPKLLVVPVNINDEQLKEIREYRSKHRIPVLTWINKQTQAAILRSSQPLCGLANKQSTADIDYLSKINQLNTMSVNGKLNIFDARPQVNAIANRTKGGGYENEDSYDKCEVTFLNIHNIHVMRESLRKIYELNNEDDKNYLINLENTKWLEHIKCILIGVNKIVNKINHARSTVLIHCSDGWDRTSQLSSLSMLILDKYYRTIKGFQVLIEKEWISFGHKFSLRMGHGQDKHSDQDRSPIFIQFIDCVYQLQQQNKNLFEFNEYFLIAILDNIYTCKYGTFLYNSEKERDTYLVRQKTISLWSYINSNLNLFKNDSYYDITNGSSNDLLICPISLRSIKLWTNYYFKHKKENLFKPSINSNQDNQMNNINIYRKSLFSSVINSMKTSVLNMNLTQEPELVKYRNTQHQQQQQQQQKELNIDHY